MKLAFCMPSHRWKEEELQPIKTEGCFHGQSEKETGVPANQRRWCFLGQSEIEYGAPASERMRLSFWQINWDGVHLTSARGSQVLLTNQR